MKNARRLLDEMLEPAGSDPDALDPDTLHRVAQARQQTRAGKAPEQIQYAFQRARIELNMDDGVKFDAETREASVSTENSEVLASQLALLMQSGLADDYRVSAARGYGLVIEFTLHPSLDNAV